MRLYLSLPRTPADLTSLSRQLAIGRERHFWAFFANPDVYRIDDAVAELEVDTWTTKGKEIRAGDWALIWRGAGAKRMPRGVVAFAEVIGDPELTGNESPYWVDTGPAREPEPRVHVRYRRAEHTPLLEDGAHRELLQELSVSRARGGTVFQVPVELWDRLLLAAGPLDRSASVPEALEALLVDHRSRGIAGRPPSGQGRGLSAVERKAVERLAVTMARAYYEAKGWVVEERGKPYDLLCRKPGGKERRVEVKGTTGEGMTVLLTRNEVEHARENSGIVDLYVVSEIRLERGAYPIATGGVVRLYESWSPEEPDLTPLAYEWQCRPS